MGKRVTKATTVQVSTEFGSELTRYVAGYVAQGKEIGTKGQLLESAWRLYQPYFELSSDKQTLLNDLLGRLPKIHRADVPVVQSHIKNFLTLLADYREDIEFVAEVSRVFSGTSEDDKEYREMLRKVVRSIQKDRNRKVDKQRTAG